MERVQLVMMLAWLALPASVSAFYNPESGRWLNRDPLGESGGRNLYTFNGNASVNGIDLLGLAGYDFRGGWALPPSCSAIAHAGMNPNPGLLMPNANEPSVGNQWFGYPPDVDFRGWFERNQARKLDEQKVTAAQAVIAAVKAKCGSNSASFDLDGNKLMRPHEVLPIWQLVPEAWWSKREPTERTEDNIQGWWESHFELGRHSYGLQNVKATPIYFCACEECYFWHGELVVTDYPGVTSKDDGIRGTLPTMLGALTDASGIAIARWNLSGIVCCGRE